VKIGVESGDPDSAGMRRKEIMNLLPSQGLSLRLVQRMPCSVHHIVAIVPSAPNPRLNLEPEPGHAAPVLVYCRLAILLRVGGVREEHALVALGLLFLAHAAGLSFKSVDTLL